MNRFLMLVMVLNLFFGSVYSEQQLDHVVLVSASSQVLPKFSRKDLRLLYLGFTVIRDNTQFEPLINASQELIYKSFLQKIVFMSQQTYERQMMTRIFRHGGERPEKFNSFQKLILSLKMKPNRITFINLKNASQLKGIQVVQQLW